LLLERGLIVGSQAGEFITLRDTTTTGDVARVLVEAGIAVDGIWQREQTLEDFYLDLVKAPPIPPSHN